MGKLLKKRSDLMKIIYENIDQYDIMGFIGTGISFYGMITNNKFALIGATFIWLTWAVYKIRDVVGVDQ